MACARVRDGAQGRNTHELQTWQGQGEDVPRGEPSDSGMREARGLVWRSLKWGKLREDASSKMLICVVKIPRRLRTIPHHFIAIQTT